MLWGVVNNAGLNFLGDIELATMRQYGRILDINAVGMVRVTKTFLPLLRHSKGGHGFILLQLKSELAF